MASRVSSARIGAFVVGGLTLVLVAIVLLGSGRLFHTRHEYVCFFRGSLNGLKVGAPVKVRGVAIGSVVQILLRLPASDGIIKPQASSIAALPVIIEIDESQLKAHGGTGQALQPAELAALIKNGLRAQLSTESLLTGLLYIELDLHPKSPINLMLEPGTARFEEIPTVPTDLEQVQETAMRALAKLDKVDIEALVTSITDAATSANDLLRSPDIKATLVSLRQAAGNLNVTMASLRDQVSQFNDKVDPLIVSLRKTSDDADATMLETRATMTNLRIDIAADSPLRYRIDSALQNLSEASSSVRQLADYLQRNPSALVRGKFTADKSE